MKKLILIATVFILALWLLISAAPLIAARYIVFESLPTQSATPKASPSPQPEVFRILNEANDELLTVPDSEFLPCALLCEMSPNAPDDALQAQAIAIYTTYCLLREQNADSSYDITCNTEALSTYAPADTLSFKLGEGAGDALARAREICASVEGLCLYRDDTLITAPYFPVSAGCTRAYKDVFGEEIEYLQPVACPYDELYGGYLSHTALSVDDIRAAFPEIEFTADPTTWFASPTMDSSGYTESISLCGITLSGLDIREALALKSAAFDVEFDGDSFIFTFTVRGQGHGVGMSQAGAIYLAENGADYEEILSYFYSGAKIKSRCSPTAEDSTDNQ